MEFRLRLCHQRLWLRHCLHHLWTNQDLRHLYRLLSVDHARHQYIKTHSHQMFFVILPISTKCLANHALSHGFPNAKLKEGQTIMQMKFLCQAHGIRRNQQAERHMRFLAFKRIRMRFNTFYHGRLIALQSTSYGFYRSLHLISIEHFTSFLQST